MDSAKAKSQTNIADRFVMQTATKGSTKQMWHLNRTENNSDDDLGELREKQGAEKRKVLGVRMHIGGFVVLEIA